VEHDGSDNSFCTCSFKNSFRIIWCVFHILVPTFQDDAHIFCLEDQIKGEIRGVLDLTEETLRQFGFDRYEVNLSTRPEKSVGSNDIWEKATAALQEALDDKGWDYKIDDGGGAFYGPKIDLKIEDALGRKWQCSTVQVIG
jgi:threonyl-tRNA synthetase